MSLVIGEKQLENLKKMPLIETTVRKSKNGNYIVTKTTITSIKPVEYFKAVVENDPEETPEAVSEVQEKVEA
jgi:hypothetical protein